MVSVSTQIEIASSPEHFLDFAKIPEWSQGPFKSIEPEIQKATIEEGDKLKVVLQGATFSPVVLENSSKAFVWRGSLGSLFIGDHHFRFEPSKITPGSTTFTHGEDFSGWLLFLFKWASFTSTSAPFSSFNEDLKRRVESSPHLH